MTCTFTVLGCSGGIGSHRRTTAFLVNDNILIDCGTGVGDLSLDQLKKIDHVFLTHSHLDHIACLPLMLDSVGSERTTPVKVYALAETLEHIKQHIFNNLIWPDFTRIPTPEQPWVSLNPISVGKSVKLSPALTITALPAGHSVDAIGYAIRTSATTLAFTGDTGPLAEFWDAIQKYENLKHLLVECSFINSEAELAQISGHYHPEALISALRDQLPEETKVWISHLKPGSEADILKELALGIKHPLQPLTAGQTICL